MIDGALHARLLVGQQVPVRSFAESGDALDRLFARTRVRLYRGDELKEEGTGINVLDGPLHAQPWPDARPTPPFTPMCYRVQSATSALEASSRMNWVRPFLLIELLDFRGCTPARPMMLTST
ncbi:MAG: hypothetical protein J7605_06665 [Variovorax sp.]|nr:hypothetical protein [Variovorax sp.]